MGVGVLGVAGASCQAGVYRWVKKPPAGALRDRAPSSLHTRRGQPCHVKRSLSALHKGIQVVAA